MLEARFSEIKAKSRQTFTVVELIYGGKRPKVDGTNGGKIPWWSP